MPTVSIILPAKNSGAYLKRCIDSVISQRFTDWELLIINDNSSDNTGDIAKAYSVNDPRIKVFDSIGSGVSAARNYGLSIATGKYFGFIDSDDFIDSEYLSTLINLAEEENACISQCSFAYYYDDGRKVNNDEAASGVYSNHEEIMNAYLYGMIGNINLAAWGKIFRSEAFADVRFDETLTVQEDAYFTFECVMKSEKISCTERSLYYYFQNPSSTMNKPFDGSKMQYFTVLDRELEILKGNRTLEERLLIRKMTTAFDLTSKIVGENAGAEYLKRLRQMALETSEQISTKDGISSKMRAKIFLLKHFPSVYYKLLRNRH